MAVPNGCVAAEELVAGCTAATGWGIDVVPVPAGLIDLLLLSGGELVTLLTGRGADGAAGTDIGAALREHVHHRHLGTELVTHHTGHRGDVLLIGVE